MNRITSPSLLCAAVLLSAALGGWTALRLWGPDSESHLPAQPDALITLERQLMGTSWKIQVGTDDRDGHGDPPPIVKIMEDAFHEVARVESIMSEWIPESPISRLNASAGKPPRPVPRELSQILQRAHHLSERSSGAFDITWKGLGNLWPLRDPDFAPPAPHAIAKARARVDYRGILFDQDRVGLRDPDMVIGLGGIAKGYGLDRAASVLLERGITNFFLDGGGDILVSGQNNHRPWRIGIRHPRLGPEKLLAIVELTQGAVATSGDYEQFREYQGSRFHHIIDPRSGYPAQGCQSVTVLAPRAELADALATAVFVLGPAEGLALVEQESEVEALVVDRQGNLHMSPGFGNHAQIMNAAILAATKPNFDHH